MAPLLVGPKTKLPDLLNQFQSGRCHLALVTSRQSDVDIVLDCWRQDTPLPRTALSHIITMEDLIEMILKETILDETDNRIIHAITHVKALVRKQRFLHRLKRRIIRKVSAEAGFDLQVSPPSLQSKTRTPAAAEAPKHSNKAHPKATTEAVRAVDTALVKPLISQENEFDDSASSGSANRAIGTVFEQVDQDGDGMVDIADLRRAIIYLLPNSLENSSTGSARAMGMQGLAGPSPRTEHDVLGLAEELMRDWDGDGDERLTVGEFQTAIETLLSQDNNQNALLEEQLDELFKVIDVDQNELITIVELHAILTHTLVRHSCCCAPFVVRQHSSIAPL